MTSSTLRALLAVVTVAGAAVFAACGSDGPSEVTQIEQLEGDFMPQTVLGLEVKIEDITAAVQKGTTPYIDQVGLYGFRKDDLLQATLQLAHFTDDARLDDEGFRAAVVSQVANAELQTFRVGDRNVFMSQGARQTIAAWFDEDYMFVLATREEFERPRSLLREILEMELDLP